MEELNEKELVEVKERIDTMEKNSVKPKEEEVPDVNPNIVEPEINVDEII